MQIASGRWQDARILTIGHAYQQATGWHLLEPPLT